MRSIALPGINIAPKAPSNKGLLGPRELCTINHGAMGRDVTQIPSQSCALNYRRSVAPCAIGRETDREPVELALGSC